MAQGGRFLELRRNYKLISITTMELTITELLGSSLRGKKQRGKWVIPFSFSFQGAYSIFIGTTNWKLSGLVTLNLRSQSITWKNEFKVRGNSPLTIIPPLWSPCFYSCASTNYSEQSCQRKQSKWKSVSLSYNVSQDIAE